MGGTAGINNSAFSGIIGNSRSIQDLLKEAKTVAKSDLSVLLLGETGTGKTAIARAIHDYSDRKGQFVPVECSAIPGELIESVLFGHEEHAFTGATTAKYKPGKFDMADKGTIFLDEIGTVSLPVQVKLLRFLDSHEFERLAGNSTIRLDVRVIAATNADLNAAIKLETFREDLYHRLNGVTLEVPTLRDRRDDVHPLADHFRKYYAERNNKEVGRISDDDLELLISYSWPGNVRELRHMIERAVVFLKEGPVLQLLQKDRQTIIDARMRVPTQGQTPARPPELTEHQWQVYKLRLQSDSDAEAARKLGLTPARYSQIIHDPKHSTLLRALESAGKTPHRTPRQTSGPVEKSNGLVLPVEKLTRDSLFDEAPEAAFRVLLLTSQAGWSPVTIGPAGQDDRYILKIDLRDQHIGIFNNRGKSWVRDDYGLANDEAKSKMLNASATAHQLLMEKRNGDKGKSLEWSEITGLPYMPLRWASGGILPVAEYEDQRYVVLFLRDILPRGWNIANGASENKREWQDMECLIGREFAEELVLLDRKPHLEGGVRPIQFTFIDKRNDRSLNRELRRKFMEAHENLRRDHDKLVISVGKSDEWCRPARAANTDFAVRVFDGIREVGQCGDVVFSINVLEFGIEVIRIYEFKLDKAEWLLDGEIGPAPWSEPRWLVRRPVMLLNLEWLRSKFVEGGNSLGEPEGRDPYVECKQLPDIPQHAPGIKGDVFHLFGDFDLNDPSFDLRRDRLQWIKDELAVLHVPPKSKHPLKDEGDQIENWLYDYDEEKRPGGKGFESLFRQVRDTNTIPKGPLTYLIAVTWKTLELAFQHGYL